MTLALITQAQGRIPVTVFQLQTRVNLENFKELEEIAKEAYANGMRDLVIDLSQTPSMTSIGVRALVIVHKLITPRDGSEHLKLAGASDAIHEMLKIAGIMQFIKMYDSVDEAVRSF